MPARFPPDELLPPDVVKLIDEYRAVRVRLSEAKTAVRALTDPKLDATARRADDEALAVAAREGTDLTKAAGAEVKLAADRDAASRDRAALEAALTAIEADLRSALHHAAKDDEASGRARRDALAARYRQTIDAMTDARAEFLTAATVSGFFRHPDEYRPSARPPVPIPRPHALTHGQPWNGLRIDEITAALTAETDTNEPERR